MQTKSCPICGRIVYSGAFHCPLCGYRFENDGMDAPAAAVSSELPRSYDAQPIISGDTTAYLENADDMVDTITTPRLEPTREPRRKKPVSLPTTLIEDIKKSSREAYPHFTANERKKIDIPSLEELTEQKKNNPATGLLGLVPYTPLSVDAFAEESQYFDDDYTPLEHRTPPPEYYTTPRVSVDTPHLSRVTAEPIPQETTSHFFDDPENLSPSDLLASELIGKVISSKVKIASPDGEALHNNTYNEMRDTVTSIISRADPGYSHELRKPESHGFTFADGDDDYYQIMLGEEEPLMKNEELAFLFGSSFSGFDDDSSDDI